MKMNPSELAASSPEDLAIIEASLDMTIQWIEKKNKARKFKRPIPQKMRDDLSQLGIHLDARILADLQKRLKTIDLQKRQFLSNEQKLAESEKEAAEIRALLGITTEEAEKTGPEKADTV